MEEFSALPPEFDLVLPLWFSSCSSSLHSPFGLFWLSSSNPGLTAAALLHLLLWLPSEFPLRGQELEQGATELVLMRKE